MQPRVLFRYPIGEEKLRLLTRCGVEVRFVQDELTTAEPEHELMISIVADLAQADNESRRENILWGIHRQLEDGTSSIYSRPCYGYTKNEHDELVIDEEQAKVVKLIFDMYLEGASILGIVRELENQRIPSPSGKPKWPKRSIELLLENETVIISDEQFSAVQEKRKRRSNKVVTENGSQRSSTRYSSKKNLQ